MNERVLANGYGFIPADELDRAVATGLLSQEEARQVYWSQFPQLRERAATTPPILEKAA